MHQLLVPRHLSELESGYVQLLHVNKNCTKRTETCNDYQVRSGSGYCDNAANFPAGVLPPSKTRLPVTA